MNKQVISNQAISASAGTGKTYALAVRYIALLAQGAAPESIAAMTFTRKAAGEILDRIITIICTWIKDPIEFEKQKKQNGLENLEQEKLYEILYHLLMKIHKLQISTLDSFYVNIIQAFPFEFGLNGEFKIIDEADEEETKLTVLKEILWHETDSSEKLNFLNEFKDATYGNEEKSILFNIKKFIDDHHEAFMQTQQEQKWGDLDVICGSAKKQLFQKLDVEEKCGELSSAITKIDLTERQQEMWNAFINETRSLVQPYKFASKDANSVFDKLLDDIAAIRAGQATITLDRRKITLDANICEILATIITSIIGRIIIMQEQRTKGMYNVLNRYEKTYDRLIRRSGMFTFRDVLHQLSLSIFDDNYPVLSSNQSIDNRVYIDYRLDSRYDHWLLDEFQDTSYLQWKVVENLIDEVMQDPEGYRSFFYVGDIKQSIYQWRSGDPRLFNAVYDRYAAIGIEKSTLRKSYRSNSEITDTVNKVFANILRSYSGQVAENETLNKVVPQEVIKRMEWQEHESAKGPGGFAGLIGMEKIKKESDEDGVKSKAEIIAERIKEIKPFEKNWSVAILLRQHKHTETFAKVLEEHGIRSTTSTSSGICDNPIVSAFLSLITLAEHPQDEFAWNHLQLTPFADALFVRETLAIELLDDICNHGYKYLIENWIERLEEGSGVRVPAFAEATADRQSSGLEKERRTSNVERLTSNIELNEEAKEPSTTHHQPSTNSQLKSSLKDFINAAEIFDAGPLSSPHDFIDFIQNYQVKFSSYGGSVQIMTIHGSKGLGFDLVFLPFNDKGANNLTSSDVGGLQIKKKVDLSPEWAFMMPTKKIAESIPNLADFITEKDKDQCYENLCLLYVSITRAAKGLYMLVDKTEKVTTVKASTVLLETLTEGYQNDPDLPVLAGADWLYTAGKADWFEEGSGLEEEANNAGNADRLVGKEESSEGREQRAESNIPHTLPAPRSSKSEGGCTMHHPLKIKFTDTLKTTTPSGSEPYITYGDNLFSGANSSAMRLGSAVHELFEFFHWSDIDDYSEVISTWKENTDYDKNMQQNAIELFEASLNSHEIFDALSRPYPDSELWREQNFSVIIEGEFINGSFDRVVINRDEKGNVKDATIMDYKTDQITNDEELEKKKDIYSQQLQVYSRVLAFILKIDESLISRKLLFVRIGKAVSL